MATLLAALLTLLPSMARAGGSLYCFSCITPDTYEVGMVAAMWKLKVGMFECDDFDIISNTTADKLFKDFPEAAAALKDKVHAIDRQLYVKTVELPAGHDASSPFSDPNSPLFRGKKLMMKHLANTPVFKDVWTEIIHIGSFLKYDYTLKLDVDAVIVPKRLSGMLANRPANQPEYFLNSLHDAYGNFLHGPVEMISKAAMLKFRDGKQTCYDKISAKLYGEDFWANKCWSLLGIPAVKTMDFRLLYDEYEWGLSAQHHCDALNPDPNVFQGMQYFGVYHPRKNMAAWLACRQQTGVPHAVTEAQVQEAVKIAGPGKPDKIIGKYELPALSSNWGVPIAASVAVAFGALAVLGLGSVAMKRWSLPGNRVIQRNEVTERLASPVRMEDLEAVEELE